MINSLGEFEQIVLLAILRLEGQAYGVPIRGEIMQYTDRRPTPGALYTVLERLEAKEMLTSWMGAPTAERGGRPKRFFKVTDKGRLAVARSQSAYQRLLKGLNITEVSHA